MYTHIGNGKIVKNEKVIGIFDAKTLIESRENKKIVYDLKKIKEEYQSVLLMECNSEGENQYEVSPIAVSTLKKRFEK